MGGQEKEKIGLMRVFSEQQLNSRLAGLKAAGDPDGDDGEADAGGACGSRGKCPPAARPCRDAARRSAMQPTSGDQRRDRHHQCRPVDEPRA